jgi:quinol-cytochrome oxidoreductase complex cytochrome b subunit
VSDTLLTILQYYGAGAATLAALVVSLNLGRRWTGWAFVVFVTSSIALVAWGFLQPDSEGIGWQNIALLIINAIGVYRYLVLKEKPGAPAGKGEAD